MNEITGGSVKFKEAGPRELRKRVPALVGSRLYYFNERMKMREIKFRAWDKRLGVMLKIQHWTINMLNDYSGYDIMQYTGLRDKNGVEIYEGDILLIKNPECQLQKAEIRGLVAFNYCAWYVINLKTLAWQKYRVPAPIKRDSMLFATMIDSKEIEVIGNIHQNKELLNDSN